MESFEIKPIAGKGRALIATKPLNVGDTIFEEEPFVSRQYSWNATYGYAACDHCLRPLETVTENVRRLSSDPTVIVPLLQCDPTTQWLNEFCVCPNCKVRYCSAECQISAMKTYHQMECMREFRTDDTHPLNILEKTWKEMHYPPETGTIMLITRIMYMYKQTSNKKAFVEALESFQNISVNSEQSIYHKMLGPNFEQQMDKLFITFCQVFNDTEFAIFTTPEAFKNLMALIGTNSQGIATSPLAEWAKKVEDVPLPSAEKTKLDECIDNIYNKVGEFAGEFLNNEGVGLYRLQSKINHSCAPNAQSTFPYSNDIVAVKAIAPIQVGEEICISYLDECVLERSRHTRQKILKENYIFVCECAKCHSQANDPDETSEDEDENMETDDDDMDD